MSTLLTRQQIVLGIFCLGLLTVLIYESYAAPVMPNVPVLRWQPDNLAAPLALAPAFAALERFAAIDARPLFNPARKAVLDAKPDVPAALPPPNDVSLIGVIIAGSRRLALLRTPGSPLAVGVSVGENVSGWTVTAVEPDHVVLHAGSSDITLDINSNRPTTAATASAPAQAENTQP